MLLTIVLDHCATQSCLLQTIVVVQDWTLDYLVLVCSRWAIAQFLSLRRVGFPDLLILLQLLLGAARRNRHTPRRHLTHVLEDTWRCRPQAQAIAPTLIARRIARRRRVDLFRPCKLLTDLRAQDRRLVRYFLRSRGAWRGHQAQIRRSLLRLMMVIARFQTLPRAVHVRRLKGGPHVRHPTSDIHLPSILHLWLVLKLLHSRVRGARRLMIVNVLWLQQNLFIAFTRLLENGVGRRNLLVVMAENWCTCIAACSQVCAELGR